MTNPEKLFTQEQTHAAIRDRVYVTFSDDEMRTLPLTQIYQASEEIARFLSGMGYDVTRVQVDPFFDTRREELSSGLPLDQATEAQLRTSVVEDEEVKRIVSTIKSSERRDLDLIQELETQVEILLAEMNLADDVTFFRAMHLITMMNELHI